MIFGNVKHLERYGFLEKEILKCFDFAKKNDLLHFEKGTHKIDEDNLFVNIVEYETKDKSEKFWEAHKEYIDLHFMLKGAEQIELNFIANMVQKDFVPKDDFLPLEGESNSHIVLNDGDFLICYPEDAHMTGIKESETVLIKKAIFKIKIN